MFNKININILYIIISNKLNQINTMSFCSQPEKLLEFLKKNYLDDISDMVIEDEKVDAPKTLAW